MLRRNLILSAIYAIGSVIAPSHTTKSGPPTADDRRRRFIT